MAGAMVGLPMVNHSLEFLVHRLRGTPKLAASIAASVIFADFSPSFNLDIMRHGVLAVGGKSQSLREDLGRILPLLGRFLLACPCAALRFLGVENGSR